MENEINLHVWQQEAMQNWIKNKGRGYVEAPTGAGKTYLGLKLIEKESLSPFLIVVPTVELKDQWTQRIRKYFPDADVQGIGGGEKYRGFVNTLESSQRKVIVGIINSVRLKELKVKTLILDEIHHYTALAKVNHLIWSNVVWKYILGLSANPIPEQLGSEDTGWNISQVYQYSLRQAYKDRVLLKPEIITKGVLLKENEREEYDELTERIKDFGSFSTFQNTPTWFKRIVGMRNEILFDSNRKLDDLRSILTENKFKKCIVFVERIDSLNDIENKLKDLDIECLSIHSGMKKKERTEVINRFINTTFPVVLANVHIFEEGLSVPQIDLLVLYSFNTTRRESLQRIGRSLHNKDTIPKIYILFYEDTKEEYGAKKIKEMFE